MAKYGAKSKDGSGKGDTRFKEGKLKSGKSGERSGNPNRPFAIGLSEARKKGGKVPAKKTTNK